MKNHRKLTSVDASRKIFDYHLREMRVKAENNRSINPSDEGALWVDLFINGTRSYLAELRRYKERSTGALSPEQLRTFEEAYGHLIDCSMHLIN